MLEGSAPGAGAKRAVLPTPQSLPVFHGKPPNGPHTMRRLRTYWLKLRSPLSSPSWLQEWQREAICKKWPSRRK